MSSGQPARGLTFSGQETGIIPWTLIGFILLSALVHALGFFLFQTTYPPAGHVGPPPVQVGLLAPGNPEADAILRWINSDDPALAAEPAKAPVPGLMSLPYIPSYTSVHARPVMAPSPEQPLRYPAGLSGLNLVKIAASHPAPSTAPVAAAATELDFSGSIRDSVVQTKPRLEGLRESDRDLGALQPARFLLGVSGDGEVRYVFIQESSGDKALDEDATRVLQQVVFRSSAEPLKWGFATFCWGSAIYSQPAASAEPSP